MIYNCIKMASRVRGVHINTDCYSVCMHHALSTEREEIMGLLMGEIDEESVIQITAMIMMRRSDKRKDRVEISPEQLMLAADSAEKLAQDLGRPMRVVGWYHSHPHITVLPSVVDCRTQYVYQLMDTGFIGLIFSVFPGESARPEDQSLQITCFQSIGERNNCSRREVELHVVPSSGDQKHFTQRVLELPTILFAEEKEQYEAYLQTKGTLLTVHNAAVFSSSLLHAMSIVEAPLLHGLKERAKILEWQNKRMVHHINNATKQVAPLESMLADIMRERQVANGSDCCR